MPKLSLYKPEKGNNYKFIDRHISQMFQVGGTDCFVHKYLGSNTDSANATADQPHYASTAVTNIQDLLFLENRDRKYDQEIYRIRGIYNVQNVDFNLSQFGLFIDNDTLFMTVHINDFINYVGRKPLSGDVFEMPHLRDDFSLNDYDMALPRYYVIEDVGRASEGFSATWFPHLYRLKLKKVTNAQQFADIFNKPALDANGDPVSDTTLQDLISNYNLSSSINDSLVQQAEIDAPQSGYETRQFYTLAVDPITKKPMLTTADETDINASNVSSNINSSAFNAIPLRTGYTGYLVGDGYPVNGYVFGHGIQFPANPALDDFFLRTDFLPNRLFRFNGTSWIKVEDAVRMNMTNNNTRQTLKTSFINNTSYIYDESVGIEYIELAAGQHIIDTEITYVTSAYVSFTYGLVNVSYVVADYPTIISLYNDANSVAKVRITLPIVNGEQQAVSEAGLWKVMLCNNRVAQRQSLSKVLKPRADF
jgi:hypothetical protein